jgi:hypothetical protein
MDESYLQVLKSEKAPTSTHYMVVRAAGLASKSIDYYIRHVFAVETGIDALRSKYEQRGEG